MCDIGFLYGIFSDTEKFLQVLDSLAVITFFCAENSDEVEKIMQIIWGNIYQESGSNVCISIPVTWAALFIAFMCAFPS